jgi:RNA polymerase sigma factor (sigma-70 family)
VVSDAVGRDVVVLPAISRDPVFTADLDDDPTGPVGTPSAALRHEPHEFAALYMRHRWSFALHARRFLSDQRDVDEVVQEAFLKLFLALPELETELQALAYARRTINNLCIDRYRAERRRPNLVGLDTVPMDVLLDEDDDDPIVAAEDAAIVREALALLSPMHREALIKREVEEKPLPQIAEELDIPAEQVKHVLHRARKALRRLLVGTHVEPGVDLDLAAVLAANRKRVVAAGTPTGAAVLVLLLVLGGYAGLRAGSSRNGGTATELPSAGSLPGLLDGQPNHGTVPALSAPVGPVVPQQRSPQHHVTRAAVSPTHKPVHTVTPVKPAAASPLSGAPSGAVTPPVAQPVSKPASSHLELSGLLAATSTPSVQGGETFTHESGTQAQFSRFVAPTAQGSLVVSQTVSSAPDGSLTYIADAGLPVDGATVSAELAAPQQNAVRNPDGTVAVSLATQFQLPVAPGGALPASDLFVVQAVYAPDLNTILAERVVVGGPNDPIPPLATPTTSVVDGGSAPATDGATVPPVSPAPDLSPGRENPSGRDQDPLPSS